MFLPDYFLYLKTRKIDKNQKILNINKFELQDGDKYFDAVQKELDLKHRVWKIFYKKGEN